MQVHPEIEKLKELVAHFRHVYEKQEKENQLLQDKNAYLNDLLDKKNGEIKLLNRDLETLRTAKAVSMLSEDKRKVKRKIDEIVREIDRSIALLNS